MLNFTFGIDTIYNFGGSFTIINYLFFPDSNGKDEINNSISIYSYYKFDYLYAGLTVDIPTYQKTGVTITPEAKFLLNNNLLFYGKLPVSGIGTNNDITIGITLGTIFYL